MRTLLATTLSIILFAQTLMAQSKADSIKRDSVHLSVTYVADSYTIYKINWHKVKTLADMKLILEAFNFSVTGNSEAYKKIKKYLIEAK